MQAPGPIILPFNGIMPTIHKEAFIAPGAVIIGDVEIGKESSVWFGCVIRGDVNRIHIGERTNIQDNTTIHVTRHTGPTEIGSDVTVGHNAMLHACTLEDGSFIGMSATLIDGVLVESGAMVAAGALVPPGKRIPTGQLWAGNPARYLRDLKEKEAAFIPISAQNYVEDAKPYKDSRIAWHGGTTPPWS